MWASILSFLTTNPITSALISAGVGYVASHFSVISNVLNVILKVFGYQVAPVSPAPPTTTTKV